MGRMVWMAAAMVLAMASGSASANAFNGAKAIASGDLRAAEREIVTERALYPDQVDLAVNLATVYLRTGRTEAARRIWAAVADQPDQEVMLNGGNPVWSHALAERALRALPVQMAAR